MTPRAIHRRSPWRPDHYVLDSDHVVPSPKLSDPRQYTAATIATDAILTMIIQGARSHAPND